MTYWSSGRFGGPQSIDGPDPIGAPHATSHGGNGLGPYQPPGGSSRWGPGAPPQPPQPAPGRWQPGSAPPQAQTWQSAPAAPPAGAVQTAPGGFAPPTFGTPYGPPPRKSRKPLIVTLCAGGAVIVVVAIVLAITLTGGTGGGGGSAGDAVKGYLAALARGDAEGALSYSNDQPASKEFLTDDILKKQIAKWPISNIRILNDDSSSSGIGMAQVHVAANFGDKTSDTRMELKRSGNAWKLDAAAIKVQPDPGATQTDAAAKTLTFFGKPIGDSTGYVFPGWIDVGSTNPYLTVTAKPLLLDQLILAGMPWVQPTFVLSDKGRDAVMSAIGTQLADCTKSNLLNPPNCPFYLGDPTLVDGTVAWGPGDLSQLKIDMFDPYKMDALFSGTVAFPFTAQQKGGGAYHDTATAFVSGTADLQKTPPAIAYR